MNGSMSPKGRHQPVGNIRRSQPELIPVIGEEEFFYGYIISLWVAPNILETEDRRLYAFFEYGASVQIFQIPDAKLFSILAKHLCNMAWVRHNTDDYGYEKLWIRKGLGGWEVEVA